MMRTLFVAAGLLLAISAFAVERPVKFPVSLGRSGFMSGIYDVGAAYVSGQPTEDGLKDLAKEGVTTVVCLRTDQEMDNRSAVPFDEAATVKELGLTYVHIPLGTFNPAALKKFEDAMVNSKGKVLLHCTVAWRATYMWMGYLVHNRHYSIDDAWKAGMNMSVTVDRSGLMLDSDVSYAAVPRKEGGRKPKSGVISKPGSKLTITSPQAIHPITSDFRTYVLWDMGSLLNSGQPDADTLKDLASKGVKTIVNLRSDEEMAGLKQSGFDEEAVAKELGMKYVSIPLRAWQTFTPAKLDEVAAAFDHSEGRVLIHCQSANRTTQVLVPYLVKYQGMSLDEATKVGETMRWETLLKDLLGVDFVYTLKPKSKPPTGG